jgi:hypothetical protein
MPVRLEVARGELLGEQSAEPPDVSVDVATAQIEPDA